MTATTVDPSHMHMPLLRALWRDKQASRRALSMLAELDINEEIDPSAVRDLLPELAPHLTDQQRRDEYEELKYLLDADARAWADGSGQPDDMPSVGAWRDELERRINEHLDTLAGVA